MQTNIHETSEDIYETNVKVNRIHKSKKGGLGGSGKNGSDITLEQVDGDDESKNNMERNKSMAKHSIVKGH